MNKNIGFIYFNKTTYGIYTAGTNLNCVILRSYLQEIGIDSGQYYNQQLPNSIDIVDDVISEYYDLNCFYVDSRNKDFTLKMIKILTENEEVNGVIFYEEGCRIDTDIFEAVEIKNARSWLEKWCDISKEDNTDVNLINIKTYQDNLVSLNEVNNIGIILNKKSLVLDEVIINSAQTVISELDYIYRHKNIGTSICLVTDDLGQYPFWDELVTEIRENYPNLTFLLVTPMNKVTEEVKAKLDGIQVRIITQEEKNARLNNNEMENQAIYNGITAFYTGFYPEEMLDGYTKHIQIKDQEISDETLEELSKYNAANSAIYIQDGEKMNYEKVKQISDSTSYLFTNLVEFQEEAGYKNIRINDSKNIKRMKVVSYHEYEKAVDEGVLLSMDSKLDLECYIEDIKNFNKTGVINIPRLINGNIVNSCMWGERQLCKIDKLPRFEVKDNAIYPCINCTKAIGELQDSKFQLIKKIGIKKDKEEMSRDCYNCEMYTQCAGCVALPAFLTQSEYCKLMKSDIDIKGFMKVLYQLKYLIYYNMLKIESNIGIEDLVILTKENHIEVDDIYFIKDKYIEKQVLFIKIPKLDKYMMFNPFNKKSYMINKNMFIICEMLFKGLEFVEIKQILEEKYNINAENVKPILEQAFSILKQAECLKGGENLYEL